MWAKGKAAAWVVCWSASGCPYERASSGSLLPAAGSAPAVGGSAEHPPVTRPTNTLLEHKLLGCQKYRERFDNNRFCNDGCYSNEFVYLQLCHVLKSDHFC